MPFDQARPGGPRRRVREPIIILLLGIGLSLAAGWAAQRQLANQAESYFVDEAKQARNNLMRRLNDYSLVLRAARGLFQHGGPVTREEFRAFVRELRLGKDFPGVTSVHFIRGLPCADLPAYEARIRARDGAGFPEVRGFTVAHPRAGGDCHVVELIEPLEANKHLLGVDAGRDAERRLSLERTRDGGELAGSGRVAPGQGPPVPGYLFRLAVYRSGRPLDTVAQRQAAYLGSVGMFLRMAELVEGTLTRSEFLSYRLTIHDLGLAGGARQPASAANLLYDRDPGTAGRSDLAQVMQAQVADRSWQLRFEGRGALGPGAGSWLPFIITGAGVALSCALCLVMVIYARSREQALAAADNARAELRSTEARLEEITAVVPAAVYRYEQWPDGRACFSFMSEGCRELFGVSPEEALASVDTLWAQVLPEDRPGLRATLDAAAQDLSMWRHDYRISDARGRLRWVRSRSQPRRLDDGRVVFDGVAGDVTDEIEAREALARSEEHFRLIAENIGDLVAVLDRDGRRLYSSPSYRSLFGDRLPEPGSDSFQQVHPDDREHIREVFRRTLRTGEGERANFRFLLPDGGERQIESQGSVIRGPDGQVERVIVVSRDVTEGRQAQERVQHLAHHDGLTDLPNRVLLQDRVTRAIAHAERGGRRVAVMLMDLDGFKTINDSLGHKAGDLMLLEVARRLPGCLREEDTVARIGGDEFVVVLPDVAQQRGVAAVAGKLLEAVARPVDVEGHELAVTGSLGIALYPQDGADADGLLRSADTAMYHAKGGGRNQFRFFTSAMNTAARQRLSLENALRQALARDQFVLHYQPQVELATGRVRCMEALLRWQAPRRGLVAPAEFIPVAEEIGLILPLGQWVLLEACRAARDWQQLGCPGLRVAVNVSARQLQAPDFVGVVARALGETGLDPELLELELTESYMMASADEALKVLQGLAELGVSLTVDDFGTGYSSLAYLKRLPIHRLKIDRSFVQDLPEDAEDAAIAGTIISMARSLGLDVVAEGVGRQEQVDFLLAGGCNDAQGEFFTMPLARAEALAWLQRPLL